MSDNRTAIYANFINRRTGASITGVPLSNRIALNIDLRQLTDSFDFDIAYRFGERIDLHSHDFVEFYFLHNSQKFQISCGYLEDFVKQTTSQSLRFQANGRNFLGQLFNLPFLRAKPYDQTSILKFVETCIRDAYLPEYLKLKGITRSIVDMGAYSGSLLVPELSDAKIAPVLQQTADEVFNLVYQNRFGQAVVWGRDSLNSLDTGLVIEDVRNINCKSFILRENFSKVFSEVKVLYTGGEQNIDYASTPSRPFFNSEKKARQIFQPEVRTFQTGTLVATSGQVGMSSKIDQLAKSILRKSNQNLAQVVIQTSLPYFVTTSGQTVPYEVNQLWTLRSDSHELNQKMRLVGIGYTQDNASLEVELMFTGVDTLV